MNRGGAISDQADSGPRKGLAHSGTITLLLGMCLQFASMCKTTIVRIAPAVNVIAATISIARSA